MPTFLEPITMTRRSVLLTPLMLTMPTVFFSLTNLKILGYENVTLVALFIRTFLAVISARGIIIRLMEAIKSAV